MGEPRFPDASPFVVLVTGPAGAGKSAVAALWAAQRASPTTHWSLDEVRARLNGFVDPERGWNAETRGQLALAPAAIAAVARVYVARGVSVVVDDAVFPDGDAGHEQWRTELGTRLVVLLPRLDVALARNRARLIVTPLEDETVRAIHAAMLPWRGRAVPVIDNSELTVEETARALDDSLLSADDERLTSGL